MRTRPFGRLRGEGSIDNSNSINLASRYLSPLLCNRIGFLRNMPRTQMEIQHREEASRSM